MQYQAYILIRTFGVVGMTYLNRYEYLEPGFKPQNAYPVSLSAYSHYNASSKCHCQNCCNSYLSPKIDACGYHSKDTRRMTTENRLSILIRTFGVLGKYTLVMQYHRVARRIK